MQDELEGYQLNLDDAVEFFDRCAKLKEDTREARLGVLKQMQKELRAIRLNDKDITRRIKNKKVLIVRPDVPEDLI